MSVDHEVCELVVETRWDDVHHVPIICIPYDTVGDLRLLTRVPPHELLNMDLPCGHLGEVGFLYLRFIEEGRSLELGEINVLITRPRCDALCRRPQAIVIDFCMRIMPIAFGRNCTLLLMF